MILYAYVQHSSEMHLSYIGLLDIRQISCCYFSVHLLTVEILIDNLFLAYVNLEIELTKQ